jgi:hypothetical protein
VEPAPDDWAYVMYTSGTTGDPKAPLSLYPPPPPLSLPQGPPTVTPRPRTTIQTALSVWKTRIDDP